MGITSEIPGETTHEVFLAAFDEANWETEDDKNRFNFITKDLAAYDVTIDVLDDKLFVPKYRNDTTSDARQLLRKYKFQKKMCQETVPGKPNQHYGQPYEFYEVQGEFEDYDVGGLETRKEWQSFFSTELGLHFKKYMKREVKVTHKGKGEKIEQGDKVKIHYTARLVNGTIVESTHDDGRPRSLYMGKAHIDCWNFTILGMKKGMKAEVICPAAQAYGAEEKAKIPKNSPLIFDIEVMDVESLGRREFHEKRAEAIQAIEDAKPKAVVRVKKEGDGDTVIEKGTGYVVEYKGKLANGTVFDSTEMVGAYSSYMHQKGQVIKCWDEGLEGLRAGTRLELICPPEKGFGAEAKSKVPPNSKLFFTITIREVHSTDSVLELLARDELEDFTVE